jgi:hypothetical protein
VSAQDALWFVPSQLGPWWTGAVGLIAAAASVLMFLTMVLRHPFNALLVARVLMLGGSICFAMTPLNSGWQPWGALFASSGVLMTSLLIATDWCNRPDQALRVHTAIWRWSMRLVHGAVCWICGPKERHFQDKGVWK